MDPSEENLVPGSLAMVMAEFRADTQRFLASNLEYNEYLKQLAVSPGVTTVADADYMLESFHRMRAAVTGNAKVLDLFAERRRSEGHQDEWDAESREMSELARVVLGSVNGTIELIEQLKGRLIELAPDANEEDIEMDDAEYSDDYDGIELSSDDEDYEEEGWLRQRLPGQ